MGTLYKDEKDFLFEILLKGTKNKSGKEGYIRFRYKGKNYMRSRILYQIYHNIKLNHLDIIHHIDRNKENDHISNLKLITQEEHHSLHHAGRRKNLVTTKRGKNIP